MARLRLTGTPGFSYSGLAASGEVEDFQLLMVATSISSFAGVPTELVSFPSQPQNTVHRFEPYLPRLVPAIDPTASPWSSSGLTQPPEELMPTGWDPRLVDLAISKIRRAIQPAWLTPEDWWSLEEVHGSD